MRSFINYFTLALLAFSVDHSFGQVKELGKAQDTRKQYIDPSSRTDYFLKTPYVNPFIGTGGHGHTYPGASMPFGMIQLSPDTRYDGWDGCSGYHYSDSVVYGFSHTHLSGTGVPDYCDLLIVPQNGNPKVDPGYKVKGGYGSHFSHQNEHAEPGFYEVHLDDPDIDVKLSVTQRSGIHQYTFNNPSGKKFILIDLDHRDKLLCSELASPDKFTVKGSRISEGWAKEQHFYFYLKLDTPYQNARWIKNEGKHKLLLTFPKNTESIIIKVGISAVDTDGAQKNLEQEMPGWTLEPVKAAAKRSWNTELDKIAFYTKYKEVLTNFYTALYHSFLNPNVFSDVDGRYRGRDDKIHQLATDEDEQYTVFSLWDTYRATHPLFTLTQADRTNAFIQTFLRQYEQGGDLPVWELAGNETECMIGYHSVSVIADAWIKGIRGYDGKKALDAMIATSRFNEFGKTQFRTKGFISSGDEPESVSKTLEYAFDDYCIAQMARNLPHDGMVKKYDEYYHNSLNFLNIFDPGSGFMRARREGIWYDPFNPAEVNFNYTEANSWQYSLYAPHAISLLTNVMGGKDSLETWLDRLFTAESDLEGRHQVDITGLIGQYAHGNEPSHHMAYLYNYTNTNYKTQFYLDSIMKTMYHNAPDGLAGNEDCGQMSSWYVLSALGLYEIAPGNGWYDLGRPLMDKAVIQLGNNKKLTIIALNNSKENKYIQSMSLNGQKLIGSMIHHLGLDENDELVFTMGPEPPKENRLPNTTEINDYNFRFVPIPFFNQTQRIFDDSLIVEIGHLRALRESQDIRIEYRLLSDTNKIFTYHEPFTIYTDCAIEARQIHIYHPTSPGAMPNDDVFVSGWVKASYRKRDKSVNLKLESTYDNQYAAAGPNTLIDGVRGNNEYRTGDWQGYWAKDVIAEVTFESPRSLHEIGVGCLQDTRSWIFYPSVIEIEISTNGSEYRKLGSINTGEFNKQDLPAEHRDFLLKTNSNEPIKKIRFTVKNFGKCPDWHLGSGNDTWLFLDELIYH